MWTPIPGPRAAIAHQNAAPTNQVRCYCTPKRGTDRPSPASIQHASRARRRPRAPARLSRPAPRPGSRAAVELLASSATTADKPAALGSYSQIPIASRLAAALPGRVVASNSSTCWRHAASLSFGTAAIADIDGTSGIQAQTFATSALATMRKAITSSRSWGFRPARPSSTRSIGSPSSSRCPASTPSSIRGCRMTRAPHALRCPDRGLGLTDRRRGPSISDRAVALDTDNRGVDVQWSENATSDSFGKNLVFARCESRYATSVFSARSAWSRWRSVKAIAAHPR